MRGAPSACAAEAVDRFRRGALGKTHVAPAVAFARSFGLAMTKPKAPTSTFNRYGAKSCTFRVSLRGGAWQVTREYVFHSEYPGRGEAVQGACTAAQAFEAEGGKARVLGPPDETVIPHHLRPSA